MYVKKIKIYGIHSHRKCIESRHFLLMPPFPTQNSSQNSLKICFPPTAEMGGENFDLLYQNSIRKYEDDLEH